MKYLGKYKLVLILILLLALGCVYYMFDPSASYLFPKCPVMTLTGYPCAGCGSQRAIHALLHMDIRMAMQYNFLVVLFVPIILVLTFSTIFRKRFHRLYLLTHHPYVVCGILFLILVWWVLRIIFGWYV